MKQYASNDNYYSICSNFVSRFGIPNCINFLDNIMRPPFWHHYKEHFRLNNLDEIPDEVSNMINAMTTAMQLKRANHNASMVSL